MPVEEEPLVETFQHFAEIAKIAARRAMLIERSGQTLHLNS